MDPGTPVRPRLGASTRLVALVLVLGLAMRLVLAVTLGLGVDESYAVAVGRGFSLSYFDHPPLSFWIAAAAARIAGSESPVVVRLPFVLLFAGTTWLTYRLGARLFGERAGAWAAVLLNLSLVFSVTSGGWVLPDGPLMFCMLAAVWFLAHVLFPEEPSAGGTMWWAGAGVFTGLAMLAKYHGVFIAIGTLAFLLTTPDRRRWLATPGPWVAASLALLFFTPVLVWNQAHDWISFRFQGGRGVPASGVHLRSLVSNLGGQAGYIFPWIWLPLLAVLLGALRAGPREDRRWFLCCLALGPIAAFTLASLGGNPGLPHWEAPGYLLLFPLLGASVAARLERGDRVVRGWVLASVVLFALVVGVAATHLATGWVARAEPGLFRRRDPGLDAIDWKDLGAQLRERGLLGTPGTFIAATDWIDAGKLGYALGPGVPVLCLCEAPHHFPFLNDQRAFLGEDAVVIRSGAPLPVTSIYASYFRSIDSIGTAPVRRRGRTAMALTLYLGRGFLRPFPGPRAS